MAQQIHWEHMRQSVTRPSPPATGISNEKCYARGLNDCSQKISREHYISKSLLEAAGGNPGVAGLRFVEPGTLKTVGINALISKILCERHNAVLSPLDRQATSLFSALRRFDQELAEAEIPQKETVKINGADVERWMLKALLGIDAARQVRSDSLRDKEFLVRLLFGMEHWPEGWGLYLRAPLGEISHAFEGVEVQTYLNGKEIWGAKFDIAGFRFVLTFGKLTKPRAELYRPAGLILKSQVEHTQMKIVLGWSRRPRYDFVTYSRGESYEGDRPQDRSLKRT